jgi:hypothetical protein
MEERSMVLSTCNWRHACAVVVEDIYMPQGHGCRDKTGRGHMDFQSDDPTLAISLSIVAILYEPCEVETHAFELSPSYSRTGRDGSPLL